MRDACLDENEIAELFGGATEPIRRDRAEQHLDRCESCRELVAGLAALDEGPAPTPVTDPSPSGTIEGAPATVAAGPVLPAGARLDHFEILSCLGGGGMGQIYAARDTKLDRQVALKLVRHELLRSPEAIARFQREARATARFNHPNIVTIHEVGEYGGQPYVALEYLEGLTLGQRIARDELAVDEALAVAEAIALALAEAHRHGVLHRDLKPANVHLGEDGRIRVLDFGLAKFLPWAHSPHGEDGGKPDLTKLSEAPVFQTRAEHIKGTPSHMAPEQWRGDEVSVAADVWALGVILYRMLGGRSPLEGATLRELAIEVPSAKPLRPLSEDDTDAPTAIIELTNACLAKAPDDRPELQHVLDVVARARQPIPIAPNRWRGLAIVALTAGAAVGITAIALRLTSDDTSRAEARPSHAPPTAALSNESPRNVAATEPEAPAPSSNASPAPETPEAEVAPPPEPTPPTPTPAAAPPRPKSAPANKKAPRRANKESLFGTRE